MEEEKETVEKTKKCRIRREGGKDGGGRQQERKGEGEK